MKIYLDVYLILNFMMNFFLVSIAGILRQHPIKPGRWGIVSLMMSMLSTGVYVISCIWGMQFMMADLLLLPLLVFIAYQEKTWSAWKQDLIFFLLLTMLIGGCLMAMLAGIGQWLPWIGKRSGETLVVSIWGILVGVAGLSLVFLLLGRILIQQMQYQKTTGGARLIHCGKEYHIRVLFDSGNQLISPYTGEKVAVISAELAKRLELEGKQLPLWIPYHSIGGEGIMPAYRLDYLEMFGQENLDHFLAAVSDRLGEESEIQMIVNIT